MSIIFILLNCYQTWAHGPVSQQAMVAVQRVQTQFEKDEAQDTRNSFSSISAQVSGEEQFVVTVVLKNGQPNLVYHCGLDTTVKPVKWGCKKQKS